PTYPTPACYTLSLHDALPICRGGGDQENLLPGQPQPPDELDRLLQIHRDVHHRDIDPISPDFLHHLPCGRKMDQSPPVSPGQLRDRKSTRLNSSHVKISYAVF